MVVSVANFCGARIKTGEVVLAAKKILKLLKVSSDSYLEIFLLDSARMRQLNKRMRRQNKTTTVLSLEAKSFVLPTAGFLGEVYLCPSTIRRRGVLGRPELKAEKARLIYYLVHGILHLTGFDHERSAAAKQMEQKEEEIFRKIIRRPAA